MPKAYDSLPKTAPEARALKSLHYFTGKPCIHGHISHRLTSNGTCAQCFLVKQRARQVREREMRNRVRRERYASDPVYRARINKRNRRPEQLARNAAKLREKRRANPEWREAQNAKQRGRDQRNEQLKIHYGITLGDYQHILAMQDGVCAICRRQSRLTLHVDHDHTTGLVRGLLCSKCNLGLGCFGEDLAAIRAAADYLEKSSVIK